MKKINSKITVIWAVLSISLGLLLPPFYSVKAFVSDTTPPSVPQNLGVTSGSDCTANLGWEASSDYTDPLGVSYIIYVNGTSVGTSTSTIFTATGLQPHTLYTFAVAAKDSSGNTSALSNTATYTTNFDLTPPTAVITYPSNNAVINGIVTFTATSTDNVGVASVQFMIDGQNYGDPLTISPFSVSFNADNFVKNTSHNLKALASDTSGNIGNSAAINFTIGSPTAPAPYAISVGQITYSSAVITWQTSIGTIGLVKYGFSSNYDKQVQEAGSPSMHSVGLTSLQSGQTYHFSAQSSLSGYVTASSTDMTFVTLTPSAGGDTTAPVVAITSPSANSQVSGITTIVVSATDANVAGQSQSGLGGVWLTMDGNSFGSLLNTAPYVFSWDTSQYANGVHTVKAFAQDNAGNSASSTTAFIVNNNQISAPVGAHPNGTLVLDGSTIYLIKDGQKAAFRDPEEYQSYGYKFSQAVAVSEEDKALSLQSEIIKALEGTLVLDKADGKTVYMVGTNASKRGFASEAAFKGLGYKFENLYRVNMNDYPSGAAITSATETHPDGALVLEGQTVWWIRGGTRQGFESAGVFNTYGFSFSKIVPANTADLALPIGSLVKFRDGTLVLQNGNFYIISDGQKLQFAFQQALTARGYKTTNAISADISSYPSGALLQ